MRNAVQSILNAVDRDPGGISVIWCPDLGLREWLVDQVENLAPSGSNPLRVADVESALAEPSRMALLVPKDEHAVVLDLDGSRDRMTQVARTQPIVLFLLRHGDGQRALAEQAPSLDSWVRASDADPEALAQVDIAKEHATFVATHGISPEEWLDRWRRGDLPRTAANYRTADDASLIEEPGTP
jgi:hypothetical protein